MPARAPLRVVIAGGGIAGLEAILALRQLAEERVELELIAPTDELTYRPPLVTEPFGGRRPRFALGPLLAAHLVSHRPGVLASVDAARRIARTGAGEEVHYDALVIACGARRLAAVPGALTFPGAGAVAGLRRLLEELAARAKGRVVFALPTRAGWPLPLYELTLLTAHELETSGRSGKELVLVTPEAEPLGLFGKTASEVVRKILAERRIELVTRTHPVSVEPGGLATRPGGLLAADRVVALARVEGPAVVGVPQDAHGFIPANEYGAVVGVEDVYVAGDAVAFPVKQGGIAAQQADAVAEVIAARAGAPVRPRPFRPVLRGLLLTGARPRYLRSELARGLDDSSLASLEALWWPPAKVAGRYLAPYLASVFGLTPEPPDAGALPVEVALVPPEYRA